MVYGSWGLLQRGKPFETEHKTIGKRLYLVAALSLTVTGVSQGKYCWADESEVPLLDTIVVTAARQEEKISRVPANVTVLNQEKIASSPAETVGDLLRTTEGVVVNDITGNGRNITVDLRGIGETAALNTLLLIDGRRVNQADLTGVDWTLIPKERIERIEIVYGGRGSVLYGDNATGGVINIITKKGQDLHFSGGLVAGSYESLLTRLAASGSTTSFSYALDGNFRRSDGYRDNSGTEAKDVGVNLEYFGSDRFSVALNSGYHQDDTELPGSLLLGDLESGTSRTSSNTPEDFSDTEDYYLQAVPEYFLTDNSSIKVDLSARNRENNAFSSFVGGTYDATTDIDTFIISPQLSVNEQIVSHSIRIVAGLDYTKSDEEITNESVFFGMGSTAFYDLAKEGVGVYGNVELSLTDAIFLSGGYRYDSADFESSSFGISDSITMDANVYNAGLTYQLSDTGSIYLGYARSFRYPVLDEMFSFFTNTFSTTIDPQTTDDFELGARLQFGSGINVAANLFRLVTDDEIFFNPARYANENLDGDTIRQGLEVRLSKRFDMVLLSTSYTFRDAVIDGGLYDGNEIPNVPRHQVTLGAETRLFEMFQLNVDGSYIGERPFISDFNNSVEYQDSYLYLTAKLAYLFENGSAYITVNNLLDEEYSQYGGLNFLGEPGVQPSPGINFLLGVNIEF